MKTIIRYYPFLVAGAFSIVAVLAATWSRLASGITAYDPHLAVLTITAVAVIWYTAFTFESLRTIGRMKRETRDERKTQLETSCSARFPYWVDSFKRETLTRLFAGLVGSIG